MENGSGTVLTSYVTPSVALGSLLTSGDLWFDGPNAKAANGGVRVKMYAPSTWVPGSSYGHLDYNTFAGTSNSLMVYSVAPGSSNHNPGGVTLGILKDLGWVIGSSPVAGTPGSITIPASDADGSYTVSWGSSSTAGATYILEEATNGSFTSGLRTAYSGTGLNATVSGRGNGTYYYRVKATAIGYDESAWRTGSNGCTVTLPGTVPIGEALDETALAWVTGGNANWFGQTATSIHGGDAAQSGDVADSQSSYVQTTVTGPATLSFYWKVSSESGWDYLRFYVDGVEQAGSISGTTAWEQKSFSVPSGSHTLKWAYTKDSSASSGSDCGWVDRVVWPPATTPTGLTIVGPTSVDESSSVTYTATVTWSDGTSSSVTPSWSENSAYATIGGSGVLTAGTVTSNQPVTITASYTSGGVTVSDTHALTVMNSINDSPVIGGSPPTTAARGIPFEFVPDSSDADGDALVFGIENPPAGSGFDPATGTLSWTPAVSQVGQTFANIILSVSDGINPPVPLDPFSITVQAFPTPAGSLLSAQFSGEVTLDGAGTRGSLRDGDVGDELAAFDGSGTLSAHAVVEEGGNYALTVYGDDPGTPEDEGAEEGETLTVRLWDGQRQQELPVRSLTVAGTARSPLVWSDNGGGTVVLHGLAQQQVGVFRPGNARWYADADGNGLWGGLDFFLTGFGISTDKVAAGDWNGDGLLDPGAFRNKNGQGWWYFDSNGSGVWEAGLDQALQFGLGTDVPAVGDWNGDGQSDFGVFRNINGLGWWYFDSNGNRQWDPGVDQKLQFGLGTDIPVVGDWNGDGQSDFGVFRNVNGLGWWYFDSNGNRQWNSGVDQKLQFGLPGDLPVAGDWNGDGLSDFGVMRNGVWYLDSNGNRAWNSGVDLIYPSFGLPGDQPFAGVWK